MPTATALVETDPATGYDGRIGGVRRRCIAMANDFTAVGGRTRDVRNMGSEKSRPIARRTLLQGGLLATGAVLTASGTNATTPSTSGEGRADSPRESVAHGVMLPYQVRPGEGATVVEADLDWRLSGFDPSTRTHVIAYDRASTYRAFFFAERPLPIARSVKLGGVTDTASTAGRYVTVDVASDGRGRAPGGPQ